MCSKTDSDVTYCSEVEEFLNATTVTLKKICNNVPLRRSQRLYEKLKQSTIFSGSNVDTKNSEKVNKLENNKSVSVKSHVANCNKFTQDIFSTQDIREVEEISQYYVSLNKVFNCASKYVPVTCGVPLDLSTKSKVSAGETSKENLQTANATIEFKNCNIKNVEVAKHDKENENLFEIPKLDNVHFNKRRQPRKSSSNNCTTAISNPNKQSGNHNSRKQLMKPLTSVYENTNSEDLSSGLKKLHTRNYKKKLQSLKDKSSLLFGKSTDLSNGNITNSIETKITKQKIFSGKKSGKNYTKDYTKVLPDSYAQVSSNQNSKKVPTKTREHGKYINDSAKISTDKANSLKRPFKSGQALNENCLLISGKRIKLTNAINLNETNLPESYTKVLNVTNTIRNLRIKSSFANNNSSIFNENSAKTDAVTDEFQNSQTKIKDIKKTQPTKRSQKRIGKLVEKISKSMNQSNELHEYSQQNVKSEPFLSLNIVGQTFGQKIKAKNLNNTSALSGILSAENISATDTIQKRLQNNSSQAKNETSISGMTMKYSGELKSNRILRSIKTDIISENNANIENRNILGNEFKRVKTEKFSQTAEEIKQTQPPQIIYSSRKTKKLSDQNSYEDAQNNNEFKNMNLNAKPKLFKRKRIFRKTPKALNIIQNIKKTDENIESKTEIEVKNTNMNKNYIKSFDRTKFLDKIQNSKNHIAILSTQNNCGKLNTYKNTLTPAESSQDLLNKSILPEVYPPHFKYQLPPEAILIPSSDIQVHPANVITPDDTELLESSSSSPSLPESLCEFFQTKHIKDILNVERKSYRLYNYHIQALALILNMRLEDLSTILDKIMNISPHVLKNIHKALKMPFVPDNDIFPTSPDELCTSGEIVLNSQNPKQRKMSIIADSIKC